MRRRGWLLSVLAVCWGLSASACSGGQQTVTESPKGEEAKKMSVAAAEAFVELVDNGFRTLWSKAESAAWDYYTDLNDENAAAMAKADEEVMAYTSKVVKDSKAYSGIAGLDYDTARMLSRMQLATNLPAPDDDAKRAELAEIMTRLSATYGKGKYCNAEGQCMDLEELSGILAESRDYDAQLEAWQGWRSVAPAMRADYARFVELGNEGARDLGFANVGELWRSQYDMSPEEFEAEVDRLYREVQPLYEQLHCYVRAELHEQYGDKVPLDGPIPAHLLGNMWAQSWENLYPMLEPHAGQPSLDVTAALQEAGYDSLKMVKTAEAFFISLGLDPLPATFWERSVFDKPADREMVCHASAWDVGFNDDLRIKMCIKIDMEDFVTIHHELGHNYYYHYYHQLPVLYQDGANDGFHEGIGDTLALSITPSYLHALGLMESSSSSPELVLNKQMQDALQKIAFLPFGRMIDQWRWDVFSGAVSPEDYTAHWWKLREQYQGVVSPIARPAEAFDPGAKYHIPANTPYMRYFLAHVLQFQFHKALCEAAGHTGPLHECSIYGSKEAGARLQAMLAMGASKPWPEALEAIAGTRKMSAEPIIEYFEPLMTYLQEENAGRQCGW